MKTLIGITAYSNVWKPSFFVLLFIVFLLAIPTCVAHAEGNDPEIATPTPAVTTVGVAVTATQPAATQETVVATTTDVPEQTSPTVTPNPDTASGQDGQGVTSTPVATDPGTNGQEGTVSQRRRISVPACQVQPPLHPPLKPARQLQQLPPLLLQQMNRSVITVNLP